MDVLWFLIVGVMLIIYAVLTVSTSRWRTSGGGSTAGRAAARRMRGRAGVDGNEVWLIAAGSTLHFAFPAVYASGFSGFYLPLMIVLCC